MRTLTLHNVESSTTFAENAAQFRYVSAPPNTQGLAGHFVRSMFRRSPQSVTAEQFSEFSERNELFKPLSIGFHNDRSRALVAPEVRLKCKDRVH